MWGQKTQLFFSSGNRRAAGAGIVGVCCLGAPAVVWANWVEVWTSRHCKAALPSAFIPADWEECLKARRPAAGVLGGVVSPVHSRKRGKGKAVPREHVTVSPISQISFP